MKVNTSKNQTTTTTWYPSYDGSLRVNPDAMIKRKLQVKPTHVVKIAKRGIEFNQFVLEAIERRLKEGW